MDTHAHNAAWKTSTACGPNQGCVEVARLSRHAVGVRDSHRTGPSEPVLSLDVATWSRFVALIKNGDIDQLR